MKRIFSGVQSSGSLHLGNYLGAIRNWVQMQDEVIGEGGECIFGIMNLHAITVPQDPLALIKSTREVAAAFMACGIDEKKSILFVQSHVQAHTELAWILSCYTPLGWLNRMTQFKEKAGKQRENAVLGLYSYPVLQAADVLAYKATHVPVGEDQKQHVELMRDIGGAFNRHYGVDVFPLPEPVIREDNARVMSLRDGLKKMSKSDPSDYARINLTDDADTIAAKIRKAKSDMVEGLSYEPETRPEAANLIDIYTALSGENRDAVVNRFATSGFSAFKQSLAEVAVEHLGPITAEMRRLLADTSHIDAVLRQNAERADAIARPVMREVKEIIGFLAN